MLKSLGSKLLRQVPRSVGVEAQRNRGIVGQPLQRHYAQKRGEGRPRSGDVKHLLGTSKLLEEVSGLRVLHVRDDHYIEVQIALLQFAHHGYRGLLVLLQDHKDAGSNSSLTLDESEEVVGNVLGAKALAVQVGQLLHLERAFLRHGFP